LVEEKTLRLWKSWKKNWEEKRYTYLKNVDALWRVDSAGTREVSTLICTLGKGFKRIFAKRQ
jgi:hypothetical protein